MKYLPGFKWEMLGEQVGPFFFPHRPPFTFPSWRTLNFTSLSSHTHMPVLT
jgi:hypothetical protein